MRLTEEKKEYYLGTIEEINERFRLELEAHKLETIRQYTDLKVDDKVTVLAKKNVTYGNLVEKSRTVKRLNIEHIRKYNKYVVITFTCYEDGAQHEISNIVKKE